MAHQVWGCALQTMRWRVEAQPLAPLTPALRCPLCSKSFHAGRTIIFAKTKQRAHRLKMLFGLAGLPPAGELHGDMTQAARLESLERFRKVRWTQPTAAVFVSPSEAAAAGGCHAR